MCILYAYARVETRVTSHHDNDLDSVLLPCMYVYYCRTYEKAVSGGGEREKGGHVLRDTTSRSLCEREI